MLRREFDASKEVRPAVASLAAIPVATLLPLVLLAACFEAIFALHTGVERIGRYLQVFYGVQNMFNKVSFVQTNPSTTGTPRLMNFGVRVRLSGR